MMALFINNNLHFMKENKHLKWYSISSMQGEPTSDIKQYFVDVRAAPPEINRILYIFFFGLSFYFSPSPYSPLYKKKKNARDINFFSYTSFNSIKRWTQVSNLCNTDITVG